MVLGGRKEVRLIRTTLTTMLGHLENLDCRENLNIWCYTNLNIQCYIYKFFTRKSRNFKMIDKVNEGSITTWYTGWIPYLNPGFPME